MIGISQHIDSYKSCRYVGESLVLESKFGKVKLNFPSFYDSATLYFKRISGSGSVLIDGKSFIVGSKDSCVYEVEQYFESLEISRPGNSTGEVAILGIKVHRKEQEDTLSQRWKAILKKCGAYRSLSLNGDKLQASTGAFIDSHFITEIETNPAEAFTRENGKIKFSIPCEIKSIKTTETRLTESNINIFPVREAPTPLLTPEPLIDRDSILRSQNFFPVVRKDRLNAMNSPILYDSSVVNEFNPSKFVAGKPVAAIRSNNINYLNIKREGAYSISTSFIRPHVEYIVVVNGRRMGGNGKIHLSLSGGGTSSATLPTELGETYISINSGISNSECKLTISVADNFTGEILLARIMIIEGIQLPLFRNHKPGELENTSYGVARSLSGLSIFYGAGVDDCLDKEASIAKNYSRRMSTIECTESNDSIKGGVLASTYSGLDWLNKVIGFFPYLTAYKSRSHVTEGLSFASLGSVDFVEPASHVWLEPFSQVSDSAIDKLKSSKMIFSPSLPNVQLLNQKCPSSIVIHTFKPLPYVEPKIVPAFENKEYILTFNRSVEATKFLIDSWSEEYPTLVVVGARGGPFPKYVQAINEYVGYDKLLYIISKSKCVIDLPSNNDYTSSFLHLASHMGVPIATSNWFGIDKNNCSFMLTENRDRVRLPTQDGLKKAISACLLMDRVSADMSNYNKHLMNFMSLLVG